MCIHKKKIIAKKYFFQRANITFFCILMNKTVGLFHKNPTVIINIDLFHKASVL